MAWRKLFEAGKVPRREFSRLKYGELFGVPAGEYNQETDEILRKQIEQTRGSKEGKTGSSNFDSKDLYLNDASQELKYQYKARINDTYSEPPENERIKDAKDILIGRIMKANPPEVLTIKGQIWQRL